ncbi:MAG TPA: hypothetical protein VGO40_17240, partial [Longimicrobium sp.]|nr:hypothetical protein [Longimicrobium sp.]
PIAIPKANVLQQATGPELFYTTGGAHCPVLDLPDVLRSLCNARMSSQTFRLSYFDLFANGLTNIGHSIYFGMDLVMKVADARLTEEEDWLTFGSDEHDFIFGFLRFLVEQNLADVDISNCLVDWHEREIQPTTIARLTSRGLGLVQLIYQKQLRFEAEGRLRVPDRLGVAQEDFVQMVFTPSHHERIPLIVKFQDLVEEEQSQSQSA